MSDLTLGLDVGARSIGWALIDEAGERIVAAGARVFPEGVDRDQQGGEKSKSRARRDARGMRRQIARRARRKRQLVALLTAANLLPADPKELSQVLALNPYGLRLRALKEKLEPHHIGRILLHLRQRRGFLSNRKADRARKKESSEMLKEMNVLATAIGERTLGQYFAELRAGDPQARLRGCHTRREWYEREFDAIWTTQQRFHPSLLTNQLKYGEAGKPQEYPCKTEALSPEGLLHKYGLHALLFFQRLIYWPKSIVGRCDLEKKEKRCERAERSAQRFRMLTEVNNLRFLDRATGEERGLNTQEREKLLSYLSDAKEREFNKIRKKLKLGENIRFNLEGPERSKLKGHQTDAALGAKNCLGKRWKELPETAKDAVVAILIHEESEEVALQRLVNECQLTADEAQRAVAANLPDGYMSYSRLAIEKLLPYLERGLLLMGDDASNSALHAANYLRPDEREVKRCDYLPSSPNLPNPIVRQALVEVRKVVNGVLREHVYRMGHKLTEIHVELAREAKKSFEERMEMRFENAKRQRAREQARKVIEEYETEHKMGIKPKRRIVDRYLLWKEQGEDCMFCPQKISLTQLLNGEANWDHILPHWRSMDDSLANKVVCHVKCNQDKGQRTPREWLEASDPQRYELVLRLAEKLPYNKQRKFQQKDIVLDHFVQRQLRDTAYISRCVSQYLKCLGARVICPRGQMTAELRRYWSLNTILNPDGDGGKNRADHRHHAVDAIVLALIDDKRLHALANARGKGVTPWEGAFHQHVAEAIGRVLVSHRSQSRLHGSLHDATFYGATVKAIAESVQPDSPRRPWAKEWIEDSETFVRRKDVTELTSTVHLEKVRDATIRELLRKHLIRLGIDPDKKAKIPAHAFAGANTPRMPSGIPIRRVRMLEEGETFRPVSKRRSYQYVKPANNHHIVYRAVLVKGEERWSAEVVTMWDAAVRVRTGKPLVDRSHRPNARFVMSLSIGEMFQMDGRDGERLLCVVRKIDQRSKRVYYKLHNDAREAKELDKDNLYLTAPNLQKRNARKVTVDPLGRIRWAND